MRIVMVAPLVALVPLLIAGPAAAQATHDMSGMSHMDMGYAAHAAAPREASICRRASALFAGVMK